MEEKIKFVLSGDFFSGHKEVFFRYFYGNQNLGLSTINPSFFEKEINHKGITYRLKFWQISIRSEMMALNTVYCQNASGALLVYDCTNMETFERLKPHVQLLKEEVDKNITIIIVGNKYELSNRQVIKKNNEIIEEYCTRENCRHFYVSAKSGFNINEAFDCLIYSSIEKFKIKTPKTKRGRLLIIDKEEKLKNKVDNLQKNEDKNQKECDSTEFKILKKYLDF